MRTPAQRRKASVKSRRQAKKPPHDGDPCTPFCKACAWEVAEIATFCAHNPLHTKTLDDTGGSR